MPSDPYLGEIMISAFGYAPRGWTLCNGQQLPIAQNQALFSLLGTTYGGNGQTTFALPDLRTRVAIGQGTSPEGTPYTIGEIGGVNAVTLLTTQMPGHSHATGPLTASVPCDAAAANSASPVGHAFAGEASGVTAVYAPVAPGGLTEMNSGAVTFSGTPQLAGTGGGQPHENRQPFLVVQFCICLQGVFPSQN